MEIRTPRTEYTYPLIERDLKEPLFSLSFLRQILRFKETNNYESYRFYIANELYKHVSMAIPIDYHDYMFDTKKSNKVIEHLRNKYFIINVIDRKIKLVKSESQIDKYYDNMRIAKNDGIKSLNAIIGIDY